MAHEEITLVTFNIHKGFSVFNHRHTLPQIRQFFEESHPDVVFLQEVRGLHLKGPIQNQMEHLADQLWEHTAYGQNAVFIDSHHGNAILSRFPFVHFENRDVSLNPLEKRGILYGKVLFGETQTPLHLFCLHLNLLNRDRLIQADALLDFVAEKVPIGEPALIGGDFNDWSGRLVQKLRDELEPLGEKEGIVLKTFPSFFPLLPLDRFFARHVELLSIETVRDPRWVGMSDHLPVLARVSVRRR